MRIPRSSSPSSPVPALRPAAMPAPRPGPGRGGYPRGPGALPARPASPPPAASRPAPARQGGVRSIRALVTAAEVGMAFLGAGPAAHAEHAATCCEVAPPARAVSIIASSARSMPAAAARQVQKRRVRPGRADRHVHTRRVPHLQVQDIPDGRIGQLQELAVGGRARAVDAKPALYRRDAGARRRRRCPVTRRRMKAACLRGRSVCLRRSADS